MDTNNPQQHPDNSSSQQKCSFPTEVTLKYDTQPLNNLSQAIDSQTRTQQSANVDAARIPEGQLQEQRRSNRIAKTSTLVNSILTFITAGVFACTVISLWLTRRDVSAAQKQFEISNRPFVAFADFVLDSIGEGQRPLVRFNLYNSGKFPAKLASLLYVKAEGLATASNEEIKAFLSKQTPIDAGNNNLILSSLPITVPKWIKDSFPITKGHSDSLKNGTKTTFISFELKYTNFLTDTAYLKKETYRLTAGQPFMVSLIDATEVTF